MGRRNYEADADEEEEEEIRHVYDVVKNTKSISCTDRNKLLKLGLWDKVYDKGNL